MDLKEEEKRTIEPDFITARRGLENPDEKDNKPYDPDELKEKESAPTFTSDEKQPVGKKFRSRLSRNLRKRSAIIATVGVLGIGGAGLFSILQGPFEILHIGNFLQTKYLSRVNNLSEKISISDKVYVLAGIPEKGRLGALSRKVNNVHEKNMAKHYGVRPIYNENRRGRLAGYEIVDERLARNTGIIDGIQKEIPGAEVKQVNQITGTNVRRDGSRLAETTRIVHFLPGRSSAQELRSVARYTSRLASSAGGLTSKAIGPLNSRLSVKKAGVALDGFNRFRSYRDLSVDTKTSGKNQKTSEEIFNEHISGGTDVNVTGKTKQFLDDLKQKTANKTPAQIKLIRSAAIKAGGPVAALGIMCSVSEIGNATEEVNAESVDKMVKVFYSFVSGASDIQDGGADLDDIRVLHDVAYDEESGRHLLNAAPLQYESEQDPQYGAQIPEEAIAAANNDKNRIFKAVDIALNFPISPTGALFSAIGLDNPLTNPTLKDGCSAINAVAGLPVISNLADIVNSALNKGLAVAQLPSTEEMTNKLVSFLSDGAVNTAEVGDKLGAVTGMGGKLAQSSAMVSLGGTQLSPEKAAKLDEESKLARMKDSSSLERYFDVNNYQSLANTIYLRLAAVRSESLVDIFSKSINPGNWLNAFNVFDSDKISAASSSIYGISEYGIPLEMLDDPSFGNIEENADIVEGQLEDLNNKYSKCFGVKIVNNPTGISLESLDVSIAQLENNSDYSVCSKYKPTFSGDQVQIDSSEQEMFFRYQIYVASARTLLSEYCGIGPEESEDVKKACVDSGIVPENTSTSNQSSQITEAAGSTIDTTTLKSDSTSVSCAPGTKDLGVADGYSSGNKVPIRVCAVESVPETGDLSDVPGAGGKLVVNSRVSGIIVKMVDDAKAAGISSITAAEGFRSMARQTYLFNCKPGCGIGGNPVASPGTSNHQLGIAIDWNQPMNNWLRSNAEQYGYKWYGLDDAPHFSPDGR